MERLFPSTYLHRSKLVSELQLILMYTLWETDAVLAGLSVAKLTMAEAKTSWVSEPYGVLVDYRDTLKDDGSIDAYAKAVLNTQTFTDLKADAVRLGRVDPHWVSAVLACEPV